MERFDEIEFTVLNCAASGYYINRDGEYKERALLLMEKGILKQNPLDLWWKDGWKLTDKGLKHREEFMSLLSETHGHVWMTNRDRNPDLYEGEGEYADQIDIFGYSVGYCNGPKCKNCGFSFCHHCDSEFEVEKCTRSLT